MNIEAFDNQIRSIKQRIKNLDLAKNNSLVYTAYFIKNGVSDCLLNRVTVDSISLVRKNLFIEQPDKVRIELYETEKGKKMLYQLSIDLRDKDVIVEMAENETTTFKGLGEAEVNQMVQNKLNAILQQNEYEAIKKEHAAFEQEIEELNEQLEESESKIQELESIIKNKSGIKYYAGLLGDILEGFGLAKEKIRGPMAALMGISDEDSDSNSRHSSQDRSGIVEDEASQKDTDRNKKRQEIIDLIAQFLQNVSDTQLSTLFSIFSSIESNPSLSSEILQFINTQKAS